MALLTLLLGSPMRDGAQAHIEYRLGVLAGRSRSLCSLVRALDWGALVKSGAGKRLPWFFSLPAHAVR